MSEDLEVQATEDEEVSLRDALESAYEEIEESGEAAPVESQPTDLSDSGESDGQVEGLPPILPPHSWSAEDKEKFNSLPRHAQEVVARRQTEMDKDYFRKSQEIASVRKRYENIDRVLEPYREQLALEGIREDELVNQMLGIRKMLDSDPVRGLHWIAQQYGVNPAILNQLPQQQVNPEVQRLQNELGQLKGYITQQQQYAQQQVIGGIESEIQKFQSETDSSGQLKRPFFEHVQAEMVPLVQAYRAQYPNKSHADVLNIAYNAAVAANPDIARAIEAQKAQAVQAERNAKAARAVKAGSSINGAPGGGSNATSAPDDIRGALEAAWEMYS